MMTRIAEVLIVEDDADWLDIYSAKLASPEYNLTKARTVNRASELLKQQDFDVVATDLKLLGATTGGFDILEMVRQRSPDTQVIIFTGYGGKQDAFEAMRRGAYDYVTKPLDYEHVRRVIKSAIEVREQKLSYLRIASPLRKVDLPFPEKFVGSSRVIKEVLSRVAEAIESTKPVLVVGASGTGKALISETIHLASKRKRFVLVSCASYSETTLERSLFGFQQNAFPGALADEAGLLEQASGGTLVLDRVNGLSLRLQKQLLHALLNQQVRRIGSDQDVDIDVRILATTSVDLESYVNQGLFSEALYEYLADTVIELPPLCQRKDEQTDDVLLVTGYLLDKYAPDDSTPHTISEQAGELLQSYSFPGNVRELEEAIRIAITKADGGVIEPQHLPEAIQQQHQTISLVPNGRSGPPPEVVCMRQGCYVTDRMDEILKAFDNENYVYLAVGVSTPGWYHSTIVETLSPFDLRVYHPSEFAANEDFCPICQPILSSRLAIVDISTTASTVFYELGLAHAIGLPCLVLKRAGRAVPAYFRQMNIAEYSDEADLRKAILSWLQLLMKPESTP
ncbi:MAG: sigma-54-dependent Fis family transcriptional regulator [Anaerolineae bacterium]|nr:sigma-54-dependent Fis family transcriptional regulator [Anaerolineae bacterium]